MGDTQRTDTPRVQTGNKLGWRKDDPGSQDFLRRFLEGGKASRFERKHPLPSAGDRFGQLTVVRVEFSEYGGVRGVVAQCDCGAPEHRVDFHNLRSGKTTRCNTCAKRKSADGRKMYWKYAAIVQDDEHRRRLLNRIAAAITRCRPDGHPNYGGRGIRVHEAWRKDRAEFLRYIVTLPGWDVPELEIDRIDTDGNYEPGNLRFVSRTDNMLNKRSVQDLQRRIDELERRLRHCKCGASHEVHD